MGFGLGAMQGWLSDARTAFAANAQELNELDAAIGDGDHGTNMSRGFEAAAAMDFATHDTPALMLKQVGMALLGNIGGAAGALYGTFFLSLGATWPSEPNTPRVAAALRNARDQVQARGRAEIGDKTMIDPLDAAVKQLVAMDPDTPLSESLQPAIAAAQAACEATQNMQARRGRAALLGERSLGHIDPGARSMTLVLEITGRHLG